MQIFLVNLQIICVFQKFFVPLQSKQRRKGLANGKQKGYHAQSVLYCHTDFAAAMGDYGG